MLGESIGDSSDTRNLLQVDLKLISTQWIHKVRICQNYFWSSVANKVEPGKSWKYILYISWSE